MTGVVNTTGARTGNVGTITAPPATGDVTLTGSETLTNKTLTSPIMTAPALGTVASANLDTIIPMTSSSGDGGQEIGEMKLKWGTLTSPGSTTDGTETYGLSNRFYNSNNVDYGAGFGEQPYSMVVASKTEHHDAKLIIGGFIYGSTNFGWYSTCSRSAGITSNDVRWMIIGKKN